MVLYLVITISFITSMLFGYHNDMNLSNYFGTVGFFLLIIYQFNNRWMFGMYMGILLVSVSLSLAILTYRRQNAQRHIRKTGSV